MENQDIVRIASSYMEITFDWQTGALLEVRNLSSGNAVLTSQKGFPGPFTVHYDFFGEYDQLEGRSHRRPRTAPADIARRVFRPGRGVKASFDTGISGQAARITYTEPTSHWQAVLAVALSADEPNSRWSLQLTNIGSEPAAYMATFPWIGGLRLGNGLLNRMVVNNQAGYVDRLWAVRGGVYGDGMQMSMQWGCAFDDDPAGAHDALGFIIRDADIRNKEIIYERPAIQVRYFPPQTLQPGETVTFPEADLMAYCGDWKRTATAYADWFAQAIPHRPLPEWVRHIDSYVGQWFWRQGQETPEPYAGAFGLVDPLRSFRDLPDIYLHKGIETIEFAFLGRGCMGEKASGRMMVHTDGDNIVREDLGGAEALRDGIASVHRIGGRTTLYVEGYICPPDSDVIQNGGSEWAVMNKDGTNLGPYTREAKWLHMCPGAAGWQDHLARTCARLVRETGADGVRLDSLGFYDFPCYHPAHNHRSPWDYNVWVRELLDKVARAVREVNPDAFLSTEGAADFFYQYFDGALTQQWGRGPVAVSRDVSPMRVAVPEYAILVYNACGPVAASLMGYPGGCGGRGIDDYFLGLDKRWRSARFPVADVVRWGKAAYDNPTASRPDVVCRRFTADGLEAIVGARPRYGTYVPPDGGPARTRWNEDVDTKTNRVKFEVRVARDVAPQRVYLCDIRSLTTREVVVRQEGGETVIPVDSNWFLLILVDEPQRQIPRPLAAIGCPAILTPGATYDVTLGFIGQTAGGQLAGELAAPGLLAGERATLDVALPGSARLTVPAHIRPGFYTLRLQGPEFLGCQRFVQVSS